MMRSKAWSMALGPAWVAGLLAATACGDSTGVSKSPTSIKVDPPHLTLGVGARGQVRVVLLSGTDTVGLKAEHDGWYTWEGTSAASSVVDVARSWNMETLTLVGVIPGADTFRFHYMKKTECTDPPMCYSSQWYDYVPFKMLEVLVQ